jgi:hypothetical protein
MPRRRPHRTTGFVALLVVLFASGWWWTQTPTEISHWRVTIPDSRFGPIELLADLERFPLGTLRLRSSSAAVAALRTLPGAANKHVRLDGGSWVFVIRRNGDSIEGVSVASRAGDRMRISRLDEELISGDIETGWFKGPFSAERVDDSDAPLRDYTVMVAALEQKMKDHLFDRALVDHPAVRAWFDGMKRVAASARNDVDMILAAQWAAPEAFPFSHFELKRSAIDVATMSRQFDVMDLPAANVSLEFRDRIGVLTIGRFLGKNTEVLISEAIARASGAQCQGLIVDLRGNSGGAFAIVPLIQGLLHTPALGGVFITQAGRAANPNGPGDSAIKALPAWNETSLLAWWEALGSRDMIKIAFTPVDQPFEGLVAIVVDGKTESAAELATQVLQSSGRAIVVGEQTPGKMLSAAHFDVGGGFVASMPVADYLAQGRLRIEGVGVTPDILAATDDALDVAVSELSLRITEVAHEVVAH